MIEDIYKILLALLIVGIFMLVVAIQMVIDRMKEEDKARVDKYEKSKKRGTNIW